MDWNVKGVFFLFFCDYRVLFMGELRRFRSVVPVEDNLLVAGAGPYEYRVGVGSMEIPE